MHSILKVLPVAALALALTAAPADARDRDHDRGWRHGHGHGHHKHHYKYKHDRHHGSGFSISFSSGWPYYHHRYVQPVYVNPYYTTAQPIVYTTPVAYNNYYGGYCREYQRQALIGGSWQQTYGTACRQPDGSWQVMN